MNSSLDNTQVLLPPFIDKAQQRDKTEKGRSKAYRLRRISGLILGDRQHKCGKVPIRKDTKYIDIVQKDKKNLYYTGLSSCGSVWACPVCSLKICYERAENLASFLGHIQKNTDYSIGFLTLTARHNLGESCKENKDAILLAWRKIQQSREYKKAESYFLVKGSIRALEVKYSIKTGWHPHLHIIFISENPNPENLKKFAEVVIDFWIKKLLQKAEKTGQKYLPVMDEKGIAEYINKWDLSDELTKSIAKTNKNEIYSFSPFEMLQYYENNINTGNKAQAELLKKKFYEFSKTFKGNKQLTYSRKLLEIYKNLISEKTDIEICTERQENEEIILSIEKEIHKKAIKYHIEADILNIIQFEKIENLILFLQEFGIFTILAGQTLKTAKNEKFKHPE